MAADVSIPLRTTPKDLDPSGRLWSKFEARLRFPVIRSRDGSVSRQTLYNWYRELISMSGHRKIIDVPVNGPPISRTPSLGSRYEFKNGGFRAVMLPPGDVELALQSDWYVFNVLAVPGPLQELRVGGSPVRDLRIAPDALCWTPAGADVRIRCTNPSWEVNLEIDPAKADEIAHEAVGRRRLAREFIYWRTDTQAARAALLLIEHLRRFSVDRLYAEGLMLAIAARAMRLGAGGLDEVSNAGVGPKIRTAVDYIHAALDSEIAVAELAAVAEMSPWRFARAFKAEVGQSPYQYVRNSRIARARRMLVETSMPLAGVALHCGFASQSHMTDSFRCALGVTPGQYRRDTLAFA